MFAYFTPEIVSGLVRHVLTTVGGAAVAQGYISASTEEQIVGGVVALVGVAWSVYAKKAQ